MSEKRSLLSALSGYPFFPCKICQREGYSGKNNDGCDHTVFERARAVHPSLVSAPHPNADEGERK
jgi:hypothetical protein